MIRQIIIFILITALMAGLSACAFNDKNNTKGDSKMLRKEDVMKSNRRSIYLAGGCFWGVEGYFKKLHGVYNTETGYANGKSSDTDYGSLKKSDHAETVKIEYASSCIFSKSSMRISSNP